MRTGKAKNISGVELTGVNAAGLDVGDRALVLLVTKDAKMWKHIDVLHVANGIAFGQIVEGEVQAAPRSPE